MSSRLSLVVACLVVILMGAMLCDAAPVPKAKGPRLSAGPLGMQFAFLPKGTTYLGWNDEPGSAKKTEIKEDFEIAIYPVTQGQWTELRGFHPSWYSRDAVRECSDQHNGRSMIKDITDEELKEFPVECVSWSDCQEFIEQLNKREKGKGWVYRMPTDAEWEYACRGGATTIEECSFHYYFDEPTNDLSSKDANFDGNKPAGKGDKGPELGRPTKVGSYRPNKLGLYDMHGNICQWTDNRDGATDTLPRGGCWCSYGFNLEAAWRSPSAVKLDKQLDTTGIRLVRVRSTSSK